MENTNYTKNRRKNCGSRCLIDKHSITHVKILKIFGHGNLHVFSRTKSRLFHFLLHLF